MPESLSSSLLIQQIGWMLVHSVWQDALIAFVLALVLKILRRARPQIRYTMACLSLAAMVAFPLMTIGFSNFDQSRSRNFGNNTSVSTAENFVYRDDENLQTSPMVENQEVAQVEWLKTKSLDLSQRAESLFPWIILCWLTGVTIYALKLGGGILDIHKLRQPAAISSNTELDALLAELSARLSLTGRIKIFASARINIPVTLGWFYPIVLIPPSCLLGLTPSQLQAIIIHELIHIKRYDYPINFLQKIIDALLFFHPAVRWTSRQIRREREYICDDLTLGLCEDSLVYARALTKVARFQKQSGELLLAATDGDLKNRIYRFIPGLQSCSSIRKSVFYNIWTFVVIILLSTPIIFVARKVLFINDEIALKQVAAASIPISDRGKTENRISFGEYGDDLSKENMRFREIALQALEGHRGSVVVMNPRSGQILTIVNQDWAFRREWAAASTFKMITAIAGIEENQLKESGKGLGYDSSTQLNLTKALAVSNNDYFASLGKNIGAENLIKYFKQLGFGERTGINYPGEINGFLPEKMDDTRLGATGGDVQVTPLQLAVFISAVANGGKLLIPQASNKDISLVPQLRGSLSISEQSFTELKRGLRAVVENGTGRRANQSNYANQGLKQSMKSDAASLP